jgi:hypothetical protein
MEARRQRVRVTTAKFRFRQQVRISKEKMIFAKTAETISVPKYLGSLK